MCVSQRIVRLISQQPPAETHCFISISNGFEGKLFKWHANCSNGLFLCTSPVLALSHRSPFYNLSLLLSHCIIMTCSHLSSTPPPSLLSVSSLVRRAHERRSVSDSLMRSAFPLNRQKERMHQLTPTYKQHTHTHMNISRFLCLTQSYTHMEKTDV